MFKGIHLTLMMGPLVPVPAPKSVLDALTSLDVTTSDTGPSVFNLSFTLSTQSPLHTLFLFTGGAPLLFMRVIIVVTMNGAPSVLVDGVINFHEVQPGPDAGHSTLHIKGQDLTALMDLQDFSGLPFPAMPAEARVALLLLKYSMFGILPMVLPSVMIDVPIPTGNIPSQCGTDLAYIRGLASRVGYVFHLEPGPEPGMSVAYWGPQIKVGVPQPALNINMDAHTNVESLTFKFDNKQNKVPTVYLYNEETRAIIMIPIPPVTPLSPPLGLIPPLPTSLADLRPVADNLSKRPIPQAIMIGMAKAAKYAEAVTGSGTLDVLRYGHILKARKLVGVRGCGPAYDGLHYVTKVTHNIKRGEYKQSFELSRNGLISTVPRVMP